MGIASFVRPSLLLPLVLVVVGFGQAVHVGWTARVARDGRPIRPGGDRRRAAARSTLAR